MQRVFTPLAGGVSKILTVALVAVTVGCAVGCGSSSDSGSGTSAANGSSGGGAEAAVAEANKELANLYKGTYALPEGPSPKPVKDKNVWVISIGQAATFMASLTESFTQAAEELGWKVTVFDGKFQSSLWQSGIRQAIAAGADAIWVANIDCKPVLAALQDAKRANIPVIINEGRGCPPGNEDLTSYVADYETTYKDGIVGRGKGTFDDLNNAWGAASAWQLIAATGGKAKIIHMVQTDNGSNLSIGKGAEDVYARCSTCEVLEKIEFVGTDLGPTLQNKLRQALTQHPDANAVHANYDDVITTGGASAVRSAGGDIAIVGVEGFAPVMKLARDGVVTGGAGLFPEWEGMCGVDEFIYLFAGKEPRPCGLGTSSWNKDHHLAPPGQNFNPNLPYREAYRKSWGLN